MTKPVILKPAKLDTESGRRILFSSEVDLKTRGFIFVTVSVPKVHFLFGAEVIENSPGAISLEGYSLTTGGTVTLTVKPNSWIVFDHTHYVPGETDDVDLFEYTKKYFGVTNVGWGPL